MSVYEILERFVAAGVLACAGLVGAEMPPAARLDGTAFATRLKALRLNQRFGGALDVLGHAVWHARERHGIPAEAAERHAGELSRLLAEVRLDSAELAAAVGTAASVDGTPGARIATLWLERAVATGAIAKANLDIGISRFLLVEMMTLVVDQQLLQHLAPALAEHRQDLAQPAAAAPAPAPPAAGPTTGDPPAVTGSSMQARLQLPAGALRRFQAILAQQPMSAEQRLARLDELGAWLLTTVSQLRKPGNEAAELRHARHAAAAALEAGDLELAMERLKTVREHMREARRRTEARIAEELQSLRQQMVEEAAATARLGELAMARMDLDAAADHFADAAGQLPKSEAALELGCRQRQAEALATKAEITAEVRAIEAAAQAFRTCRRLLLADTDPRTRVRIGVGLGDMLVALAARQPDAVAELDEAIAAYADAVASIDRVAKPMQWALVQLSHGAALIDLGQRRDRDRSWRQAAAVLMAALDVFESRGAADLAQATRIKLRAIAAALGDTPLLPQARSA